MAVNIKREKKKHMLTMSHAKHLHDSLYGATFSVVFWLLNPLFERMVKLLSSLLHKLHKSFCL